MFLGLVIAFFVQVVYEDLLILYPNYPFGVGNIIVMGLFVVLIFLVYYGYHEDEPEAGK